LRLNCNPGQRVSASVILVSIGSGVPIFHSGVLSNDPARIIIKVEVVTVIYSVASRTIKHITYPAMAASIARDQIYALIPVRYCFSYQLIHPVPLSENKKPAQSRGAVLLIAS